MSSYSRWTVLKVKTSSELFFISFDGLRGTERLHTASGTSAVTSVVLSRVSLRTCAVQHQWVEVKS